MNNIDLTLIKQYKFYFIGAGILILFLLIVLFFSFQSGPSSQRNSSGIPLPSSTTDNSQARIISVSPASGTTQTSFYQPITIKFSTIPSDAELSTLTIQSNPSVQWAPQVNDRTITFIPSTQLLETQKYTVLISYKGEKRQLDFTTSSLQQAGEKQNQADTNFSRQVSETLKNYPWIQSLPLQTNDYFVYFDTNKKSFTARIYTTSTTTSTQIENIKTEITGRLTQLGINTTQYPIEWQLVE